jgi:hypothetical protein
VNSKWQRTFEVRVPVERLWQSLRDNNEYGRILAWPDTTPEQAANPQKKRVIEAEPMKLVKFEQRGDGFADRAEFTIVMESTETGSRFTFTRCGFGDGDAADVFGESNFLGYCHGLCDLIFYLETGQAALRHYKDCAQSCTGMIYKEYDWGVKVLDIVEKSFASEVGLVHGDRIVRIGGVPVYTRNDIWGLVTEHGPGTELTVDYVRGGEWRQGKGKLSDESLAAIGE